MRVMMDLFTDILATLAAHGYGGKCDVCGKYHLRQLNAMRCHGRRMKTWEEFYENMSKWSGRGSPKDPEANPEVKA